MKPESKLDRATKALRKITACTDINQAKMIAAECLRIVEMKAARREWNVTSEIKPRDGTIVECAKSKRWPTDKGDFVHGIIPVTDKQFYRSGKTWYRVNKDGDDVPQQGQPDYWRYYSYQK